MLLVPLAFRNWAEKLEGEGKIGAVSVTPQVTIL